MTEGDDQDGVRKESASVPSLREQEMRSMGASYGSPAAGEDVTAFKERSRGSSTRLQQSLTPATFSDAIDAIGMGPFQARLVIMCGMGFVIDAIEILVISFVLEDAADTFDLSAVGKGLIGSASFFGMLIGAAFWSVFADKRGRRKAFVFSLGFVFVGGIASAFSPTFVSLCVCRVLVGFGVGGNLPVTTALLTEFLPTSHRADVLCRIAGTFWGIGIIAASLMGLFLTSILAAGQEETFWRCFLGLAAIPSAMVAVAFRFLPESPRFLHVMQRCDEASEVLEQVARVNGKLEVLGLDFAGQIADDSHENESNDQTVVTFRGDSMPPAVEPNGYQVKVQGERETSTAFAVLHGGESVSGTMGFAGRRATGRTQNTAEAGDVRELFHTPILRRITLCLWVVWLFLNLSYYGVTFVLPVYFDKITGGRRDAVYILATLVGISYIPGAWMAMRLCAPESLGRVGSLKWSSFATAAFILLMAAVSGTSGLFVVASLLALFSIAIPGSVMYLITPELYSTKYRAVGLGSCSVVTRLGGLMAPVLAEVLYDNGGVIAPLLIFGPFMIITGIAAALIPIETAGRKLDDDSWDVRNPVAPDGSDGEHKNGFRVQL